jgi:transcriptional regulator with XRE-family HTH domain
MKSNYKNIKELTVDFSPYISAGALARICGINEGQMRQYSSGVRNPSKKTIDKINEKIRIFAEELAKVQITGA